MEKGREEETQAETVGGQGWEGLCKDWVDGELSVGQPNVTITKEFQAYKFW